MTKKLCLTEINFSEKDKLYVQGKKSLKKYCTDGIFAGPGTSAEIVKCEHGVKQRCLLWVAGLAFMIIQTKETVGRLTIVSRRVIDHFESKL